MAKDSDTDLRISALEQQNRELQSRLDALAPKPAAPRPQPAPVQEEGVVVTYPRSTPIEMPTTAEFVRLLSIVARAQPNAVPKFDHASDQREFFRGFVASFERIASLRRLVGEGGALVLNTKYDARWWADESYRWLRDRGTPAETMNGSFFAAAIAAGDVAFSFANRAEGISAFVGLGYDGITASTKAWQRVLSSGQPRPRTAPPAPLRAPPSPSQVRIMG
jgi:hypothetical protein